MFVEDLAGTKLPDRWETMDALDITHKQFKLRVGAGPKSRKSVGVAGARLLVRLEVPRAAAVEGAQARTGACTARELAQAWNRLDRISGPPPGAP